METTLCLEVSNTKIFIGNKIWNNILIQWLNDILIRYGMYLKTKLTSLKLN